MNHLLSVERLLNLRTAFRFVIKKPVLKTCFYDRFLTESAVLALGRSQKKRSAVFQCLVKCDFS